MQIILFEKTGRYHQAISIKKYFAVGIYVTGKAYFSAKEESRIVGVIDRKNDTSFL
tara:strand:+ start:672 stop:839 length:168 start_codon:yes stop_codon:yes gene_type:complete